MGLSRGEILFKGAEYSHPKYICNVRLRHRDTSTMSKPATPTQSNSLLLRRQLVELTKHPVEGFSAGVCPRANDHLSDPDPSKGLVDDDNLYEWEILIIGYV